MEFASGSIGYLGRAHGDRDPAASAALAAKLDAAERELADRIAHIETLPELPFNTVEDFVERYHLERNHQRLDNRLITPLAVPVNDKATPGAPIGRRERLGGLLSYYYRAAA